MAGLAAAHELVERGFEVTVYERKSLGGKARSIPVKGTATGGRRDLPGEHGFRFFPGFYSHIPDTMARIPFGTNQNGVFDNLVGAGMPLFPRSGGRDDQNLFGLIPDPRHLATPDALIRFITTSCSAGSSSRPSRRRTSRPGWSSSSPAATSGGSASGSRSRGGTSWRAAKRSPEYQTVAARGLTRALVAAKEEIASTRTIGNMAEAFLYSFAGIGTDGPSSRPDPERPHERGVDRPVGAAAAQQGSAVPRRYDDHRAGRHEGSHHRRPRRGAQRPDDDRGRLVRRRDAGRAPRPPAVAGRAAMPTRASRVSRDWSWTG